MTSTVDDSKAFDQNSLSTPSLAVSKMQFDLAECTSLLETAKLQKVATATVSVPTGSFSR